MELSKEEVMTEAEVAEAAELEAMTGAWRDLAARWDLTFQERRALLPQGGEDRPAPPEDTERRMRLLIAIGYRVTFGRGEELREWLRMPCALWDWHSPLEVMSASLADLGGFRRIVEEGHYS